MRHVFLIGLSGSGKSTVGRLLAQRLARPLLDLDALIEEECGERIPAIFAQHGEEYFRDCESRVLAKAVQQAESAIIVTGGGIIVRSENRALMSKHGIRVYLQVEPRVSLQRLQDQHEQAVAQGDAPELRPMLAGPDPLARLQHLLAERGAWYEEAELTCSTMQKSAEQVTREIIAMLLSSGEVTGEAPIVRHVHVGTGYDTIVDWGGIGRLPEYLAQVQQQGRVFLITDSNLHRLYALSLMQKISNSGFEPHLYVVPAGETSKSMQQLSAIYDWLIDLRAERRETIIAFGGGVVGDLVGYVAASYLRGVPLIQIPTSLLAQVDSAIGGKTGINHTKGKNLIGAFYHPRLVLADPATLLTLPERERTEGWAEIVKYGIILDAELFALLETYADALRDFSRADSALICQIVARCIDLKVAVVEEDEREQGLRAILNYGHTIGHALENASGYGEWLHGEAVSLGMVAAARLAQEAGMFAASDVERQNKLLAALGLPVVYRGAVRAQDILATMQLDKKVVGKRVRWVMPQHIGKVTVTPMPDDLVTHIITDFFKEHRLFKEAEERP
ncbi:MAG TPA: 3-dehydroquinate synthase [Ktedonobacteraceae bacterium]|nr:3-dehydroquinate synthase [Ktedonobacteraceae bacterium]